jgi:diguanylate cyclase (GGDEF)-like protein/PAS domain S-box-containing protein
MTPRTLTRRFVVVMVTAAMLLALLAAALSYHLARARAEDEARAAIQGLVTAIENSVNTGVYARDEVLLGELVAGMVRHPQVDAAQVLDSGGVSLAFAANRPPTGTQPRTMPADGILVTRALTSPFDRHETLGRLLVHADAAHLRGSVRGQAWLFGLTQAGLIVLLALLLNFVALRLLVRPLSRMARQLALMHPGSTQRVVLPDNHATDEMGMVANAANRLLDANQAALENERALRAQVALAEARYRQIFDYTSAGIFLLTPRGHLLTGNRAISRLIDANVLDMQALNESDFIEAVFVDPVAVRDMVASAQATGQTISADLELRTRTGQRRWVHALISVRNTTDDALPHLIEGVVYDVTQRRMVESQTAWLADHDALTGLKSRAFFHKALHQRVERARDIHSAVTLIFIDLDQFKQVNDNHGHEAGDRVLVECARRLQGLVPRGTDLVARLGGDEFTLVLDGVTAEDLQAQELARRIVRALIEPVDLAPGARVCIGASVGVASFPLHAGDSEELLRAADRAMYEVKRVGKSAWRVADSPQALAG